MESVASFSVKGDSSTLFILNEKKPGAYCDRAFSVLERRLFRKGIFCGTCHEKVVVAAEAFRRSFGSFFPDRPGDFACLSMVESVFVIAPDLAGFEEHNRFKWERNYRNRFSVVHDFSAAVVCF